MPSKKSAEKRAGIQSFGAILGASGSLVTRYKRHAQGTLSDRTPG